MILLILKTLSVIILSLFGMICGYDNKWMGCLFCAFLIFLLTK